MARYRNYVITLLAVGLVVFQQPQAAGIRTVNSEFHPSPEIPLTLIVQANTSPLASDPPQSIPERVVCESTIKEVEAITAIPTNLLLAIAYVESNSPFTNKPWPWMVNVAGNGYIFTSGSEAISAVEQLIDQGVSNIDIGCMQINYFYHQQEFVSVAEMFDPSYNVSYASKFLLANYERSNDWDQAIKLYHSANPERHHRYYQRVKQAWDRLNASNSDSRISAADPPPATRSSSDIIIDNFEQTIRSKYALE